MTKVFLDTNIIIDFLIDRKPFSKFALQLFELGENGEVQLFVSSHAIATTHYILKKYMKENDLREILSNLLDYIQIVSIDQDNIKKSLKSKHKDFEDAIQINAANLIPDLLCIVTRNTKDFKNSEIKVYSPEEYFLNN